MRRFHYFRLSLLFVPLVLFVLLSFSSPPVFVSDLRVVVAGRKVQKTIDFVPFLIEYKSDMPRQRRSSRRMNFFEQNVFHEDDNIVPIEVASVAANVADNNGNIADLAYPQSFLEPHVSNGDRNRAPSEGTAVFDVAPTRITGRKRKFEKGEGSSNIRGTVEQGINGDGITEISENFTAGNQTSCGQLLYQKKRRDIIIEYNDDGDDGYQCTHCNANFWLGEANKRRSKRAPIIYTECCQKGRVKLEQLRPTPTLLEHYLNPDNGRESMIFRENIRVYNSMFAYTSMGAKIDYSINDGFAPYVFKICGQVHHLMGSMLPRHGESPKYAQLYIYDSQNEVSNRMNVVDPLRTSKVEPNVIGVLIEMFDELSELSKTYRAIRDRFQTDSLPTLNMTILAPQLSDNKQYECPSNNEIGGLVVGDIGEFDSNKDIVVQSTDGYLRRISKIHPKYMSLQYPILFPYGENGFNINLLLEPVVGQEQKEPDKMSMRSFITYYLHDRNGAMSTLLKGGRLFQQYLVDAYATVDENRLDYIRQNQDKIRTAKCDEIYAAISSGIENSCDIGQRVILPSSHTGCPRDMVNNYHDAMAICRQYGNPDLFITFTCNPKWIEIVRYFERHRRYKPEDRPDIVSRIFQVKLKDMMDYIKSGKPFGQTKAHVHTVEFQKRGLPHAHILFWLMKNYKCYTPTDIDSIISAELPDKNVNPVLFNIVSQSMIHGPCGLINLKSPCMRDKHCSKSFPKPYNSYTIFEGTNAPIYKRRNDSTNFTTKNGIKIGNEFVVPYNAELLLRYNAHINVELCSQSMLIKYLFKYINKGPDRARIMIYGEKHDEIQNYLNCRYLTPHESVWRLFEFSIHSRFPAVQHLVVHLPSEQNITFKETDTIQSLINYKSIQYTTLTAWFVANKQYEHAKELTYPEFPTKYVWKSKDQMWQPRQRYETIGRMAYISPMRGEVYFLRMLLNVQKGCCNYKDIRTVNNVTYSSYQEACQALGLLGDDKEWIDALVTSSAVATAPQMRQLFVTIILFCEVANPQRLLDMCWPNMCEDIVYKAQLELRDPNLIIPELELKNKMLFELEKLFNISSSSLEKFQLPMPNSNDVLDFGNKLLREELNYDCELLRKQHSNFVTRLNNCQKKIYDYVITAVEQKKPITVFVHGSGGTGKTFLWHTIISKLRSEGKIVLAVASSGIASLLLPNGRTAHSRFKIPIDIEKLTNCLVNKGTDLANLIKKTDLIIWDEAPMCDKRCFESLDKCLCDILKDSTQTDTNIPFGGKPILLGGDFRQILPVVFGKGKEEIIQASINHSYLWKSFKVFSLTENMRLMKKGLTNEEKQEITTFANWLLQVGEGQIKSDFDTNDSDASWIEIPDDLLIHCDTNTIEALFVATYPNFSSNYNNPDYLRERAIVTPRNITVNEINNYVVNLLPGDKRIYLSSDTISHDTGTNENIDLLYPTEFLNQLEFSGLPTHELILKVDMPIMLLRNLNQICGLCNGTRLIITKLFDRLIEAEILTGNNIGHKVFIPRIISIATENKWPFKFKRRQFPVRPCYAMTINKSQGQSLNQVGVYLSDPVFTHGQLYVAASRVTSKHSLKFLIRNNEEIPNKYTKNIVFKDVLKNL